MILNLWRQRKSIVYSSMIIKFIFYNVLFSKLSFHKTLSNIYFIIADEYIKNDVLNCGSIIYGHGKEVCAQGASALGS